MEWDAWERNIEMEEAKKKGGKEREDRVRDVSFERKRRERRPKSKWSLPGQEREDEARRASYVRQRLFQKVNGFSQMVQEIQMAQQERVDTAKEQEQQEEVMKDSLVQTLRLDTWDAWDW